MESSCYDRPAENEVYISIKIKGSVNHADPLTCQNKSGKEKWDRCVCKGAIRSEEACKNNKSEFNGEDSISTLIVW